MVPCGRCLQCRMSRAKEWSVRCFHEASLHRQNCFLTLTYNNAHLPAFGSLSKRDVQLFLKRLRKAISPVKIRYFLCGEYGSHYSRPHYHLLIFGWCPFDLIPWATSRKGSALFRSSLIERLWPFGFSTVGEFTLRSAAYVARYCMKKVTGKQWKEMDNGKIQEFTLSSRRPAIGRGWFERFGLSSYPSDFCIINEKKVKPPRYYDKLLQLTDDVLYDSVKAVRKEAATSLGDCERSRRAAVREELLAQSLTKVYNRDFEES